MGRLQLDPANLPQLSAAERTRLENMTDAEITRAAEDDPDNPPLTAEELEHLRRHAPAAGERRGGPHARARGGPQAS